MIRETVRTYHRGLWAVQIEFVNFCSGSGWFRDLYTKSPHIGGVTVQMPKHLAGYGRADRAFYIGQTKPSELASAWHKEGRENPSKAAYESLQRELEHYAQAQDCAFCCTVSRAGVILSEAMSVTFDTSDVEGYYAEPAEHWKRIRGDYQHDFVTEAIREARAKVEEIMGPRGIRAFMKADEITAKDGDVTVVQIPGGELVIDCTEYGEMQLRVWRKGQDDIAGVFNVQMVDEESDDE